MIFPTLEYCVKIMVKSREEINRDYYLKNKEKRLAQMKAYNKEYYLEHKDKVKAIKKDWRVANRQKVNDYKKKRRREDITTKLAHYNRNRIRSAMLRITKGGKETKRNSSQELLGCTYSELKTHLQSQLPDGEDLQNYSIDHIIPCAAYDLTKEEDMRRCFNYLNMQPLSKSANSAKGAKLPPSDVLDQMIDLWPTNWPLPFSRVTLKLKWRQ